MKGDKMGEKVDYSNRELVNSAYKNILKYIRMLGLKM